MNIPLSEAPIFREFFRRILLEMGFEIRFDLENTVRLVGRCSCFQHSCASVYLQKDTPWSGAIIGGFFLSENRGFCVVQPSNKKNEIEFEARDGFYFPYIEELNRLRQNDFSPPSEIERDNLDWYFYNIKMIQPTVVMIDE
jgi:hypothetical protein